MAMPMLASSQDSESQVKENAHYAVTTRLLIVSGIVSTRRPLCGHFIC
jgi:hypothetical protein